MSNTISVSSQMTQETITWKNRVLSAGGGFEWNSVAIANDFVRQLKAKSYYSKIVYLLPLLGKGITAATVPLIDRLNVGAATNANFVDADFNQSTGLQGNGTTKYLNSLIKASQLGESGNGALGYWENNINLSGNVQPMGAYNTAATYRYVLDLRSTLRAFRWGSPSFGASQASSAVNGHYYGQRNGATSRVLYLNGLQIASNASNDPVSGTNERNIIIVGGDEAGSANITPWPGRCALAYMTNGSLSSEDIFDLDSLLRSFIFGPTGRPTS